MLLFDKENTWMKKGRNQFDVEMGTNDGAKVWKLVETFSLVKISEICNKNKMGLYRNGCLSTFRNKSGSELETIKKLENIIWRIWLRNNSRE